MPKIAFIGAGSTVFTRNLVGDVLSHPELRDDTTFALMDIDAERLRTAEIVASAAGRGPRRGRARSRRRTDRRAALDGADYVVTSFQVGGYKPSTVVDFEVPEALRAAPDDRRHARRRRDHARPADHPGAARRLPRPRGALPRRAAAQLRQPDGDAVLGGRRGQPDPHRRALPLRAGHRGRARRATSASRPRSSTTTSPASTTSRSSCASSTTARTSTPRCARSRPPPDGNRVRYELLEHFGYFVTESSEHFAEYVAVVHQGRPRRPDRALQRAARRVPAALRAPDRRVGGAARRARGDGGRWTSSAAHEYGADIIRACETGEPFAFNGNVPNRYEDGLLIDNLPADCCVEVPCVASTRGIEPQPVGALPRQLAALMQTNVNVQGLTVEAALTGRREAIYQAAMLDPHTAARALAGRDRRARRRSPRRPRRLDPAARRRVDVGHAVSTGTAPRGREDRVRHASGAAARCRGWPRGCASSPTTSRTCCRSRRCVGALGRDQPRIDLGRAGDPARLDRRHRRPPPRRLRPRLPPLARHPRALGAHRRGPQARRGDAADRRLPDRRPALRPGRPSPRLRRPRDAATRTSTPTSSRSGPSSAPTASCSSATCR